MLFSDSRIYSDCERVGFRTKGTGKGSSTRCVCVCVYIPGMLTFLRASTHVRPVDLSSIRLREVSLIANTKVNNYLTKPHPPTSDQSLLNIFSSEKLEEMKTEQRNLKEQISKIS